MTKITKMEGECMLIDDNEVENRNNECEQLRVKLGL